MNNIKNLIYNKHVFFIPIYSMRSYKTGKYNLMADGNVSRLTSKLIESDFKRATILMPEKERCENLEEYTQLLKRLNILYKVDFAHSPCYGQNAGETRMNEKGFANIVLNNFPLFDLFVIEPTMTAYNLIKNPALFDNLHKLIYWCPLSKTNKFTPTFVEKYALIDCEISSKILTAVATESQRDYLQGLSFVDDCFYDPKPFDKQIIFFPFRLSDPAYKAHEFEQSALELKRTGYDFSVLYTDPNESDIFQDDSIFIKIPPTKELYMQLLKSKPIIPYLENPNILHISVTEFAYYNCHCILFLHTKNIFSRNFTYISDISELTKAIEQKLQQEA